MARFRHPTVTARDGKQVAALIPDFLGPHVFAHFLAMLEADGRDAFNAVLGAVQAQFPGLVMRRTSAVDAHHDLVRFNWAFGTPGEDPAVAGVDVAKFDADGKLHRIIGFAGETIA